MKKTLMFGLLLSVSLSSFAFFQKDKPVGYALANCKGEHPLRFNCCVYDQMEDSAKIAQWVPYLILKEKQKHSMRGSMNLCDVLGVGVHHGMTFSYETSKDCRADSPIYRAKGETYSKVTLAQVCKSKNETADVEFHGAKESS